jgi:hypothetical protein
MSIRSAVVFLAIVAGVSAHLSRLPGAFANAHLAPLEESGTCETSFTANGFSFNLTSLALPTGGYIANNTIDSHYYCINLCKNVNSDRNWCVLAPLTLRKCGHPGDVPV